MLIPIAPVKNQCSRNYFYGKDSDLDRAIKCAEDDYSAVRDAILNKPQATLSQAQRDVLKSFWLMQHLRTDAASQRISQMMDDAEATFGFSGARFRLEIHAAVQMAMSICFESQANVADLRVCLIRNASKIPFVTSDDPAVLTRCPLLRSRHDLGGGFGTASAGVVLLLPLSPDVMFVAYDRAVYSIPHSGGWLKIRDPLDIDALNQHQFLNACANIFVSDVALGDYAVKAAERLDSIRPVARHRVQHYAYIEATNRYLAIPRERMVDYDSGALAVQPVRVEPLSWPKQLQVRADAHGFGNGSAAGLVRVAHMPARETWRPFKKFQFT